MISEKIRLNILFFCLNIWFHFVIIINKIINQFILIYIFCLILSAFSLCKLIDNIQFSFLCVFISFSFSFCSRVYYGIFILKFFLIDITTIGWNRSSVKFFSFIISRRSHDIIDKRIRKTRFIYMIIIIKMIIVI